MKIFLFIFLTIFCKILYAQDSLNLPTIGGKSFFLFIDEEFRNNFNSRLATLGLHGTAWVKFRNTADGTLEQIESSPGTHPTLALFLKEILLKTNGHWSKNQKEPDSADRWIILPINYTLQKNGKTEDVIISLLDLQSFFSPSYRNQSQYYTFLPVYEYVSPFDQNQNWGPKVTVEKKNN